MIKYSLIYGTILMKFAVNINTNSQQVEWPTYFSCSLTARTHVSARVRARSWLKHSLICERILFKFAGNILKMTTRYVGYNWDDVRGGITILEPLQPFAN
jgi:hypothetical protein